MCSLTQRSKSSLSLHNCHCLGKRLSSFAGKTRIPAVDSPQNRKECHLSSVFSFCDISHVRQLFGCVATRATLQRSPRKSQQLLDWHCTCWSSLPMDTTVPLVSQQRRKAPAAPTYSKNPKKSRMELSPNKLFSLIHVCLFSRVSRGQGYPQPTTEGNKSGNSADKARCAPP